MTSLSEGRYPVLFVRLLVLICVAFLFLGSVGYGVAQAGKFYVDEREGNDGNWYFGGHTRNYVYQAYLSTSASHKVNSIYAETWNGSIFVEVGWFEEWDRTFGLPRLFYVWQTSGGVYHQQDLEFPSVPSNHKFVARYNGAGKYLIIIDNVQRDAVSTTLTDARILANAERYDPNELPPPISSNYGHFYDLIKYTDSTGHWAYWVNMVLDRDNDPVYHANKISNTEYYSQQ